MELDWLDEVERRANAATDIQRLGEAFDALDPSVLDGVKVTLRADGPDAEFVLRCRTDIPRLIALVRSHAEALRVAREALVNAKGNAYLYQIGELTAEQTCHAIMADTDAALARIDGMVKP